MGSSVLELIQHNYYSALILFKLNCLSGALQARMAGSRRVASFSNEHHTIGGVSSASESINTGRIAPYLYWFHHCIPSRVRMKAEEWSKFSISSHSTSHTAWAMVANSVRSSGEIFLKDFLPSLEVLRQLCELQLVCKYALQTPNICQTEQRCIVKWSSRKDQA